jgi:hypothetical protein
MSTRAPWLIPGHRRFLRQIGKNVHLSGGVGIGGVFNPCRQATIIGTLLHGARSSCRGVVVGEGSVISWAYSSANPQIIDRHRRSFMGRVALFSRCPRSPPQKP